MALLKKRKINQDELIYSDNVGIQWQALFESGNYSQSPFDLIIYYIH